MTGFPAQITVIDDSPAVRSGLKRLLRTQGIAVATYTSAEEFLDQNAPALRSDLEFIIADISLPGMSGIQLVSKLRKDANHVPVILITAHEEEETRTALSALDSPICLRKPFAWATLEQAIRILWEQTTIEK